MLRTVVAIASKMHRFRLLLWAFAGISVAVFVRGLASDDGTNLLSLGGMIGLVWAGFLIAMTHLFAHRDYRAPAADAPLLARLRWRLLQAGMWLALGCLAGLAVLLIMFSGRALNASK